jgi:hypothetical protein
MQMGGAHGQAACSRPAGGIDAPPSLGNRRAARLPSRPASLVVLGIDEKARPKKAAPQHLANVICIAVDGQQSGLDQDLA